MALDRTYRVMVIDHDAARLERAGRLVEECGFEAVLCGSAERALETLRRAEKVDLIVTDLCVPGLDGWQLCRLLRSPAFPSTNRTPVLVLSAAFDGADVEEISQQIGANAILHFPYDPGELTAAVQQLVHGHGEVRSTRALVVEGSEAKRKEVVYGLRAYGFEVAEAQDGESACKQARASHPHVTVLSHRLPDTTAPGLVPRLKSGGAGGVVIVMTEDLSPERVVDLLGAGADAYVRSPLDMECLVDQITKALRKRTLPVLEEALAEMKREFRAFQERYEAVVEGQTELFFRYLPDGKLSFVNDAFCRLLGRQQEELIGESVKDFVLEDDGGKLEQHLASLTREDPVATTQHRIVDANGEVRWVQRTDRGIFDERGGLVEFRAVGRDVTERNRAEEALKGSLRQITLAKREWESTADSLPQFVCLLDAQGRIVRANRTMEHWNLGRVEDVKMRDIHDLLHPGCSDSGCHLQTLWADAWKAVKGGRSAEYEAEDCVLERHLAVQVRPIAGQKSGDPEERTSFAVVTVEDITDRKRAEQALDDERASLARRVDERTAELRTANVQLARAARLKDEFLASMSHEFRTPLNTILGISEALQEGIYGPCTDRQRESLQSIRESGHHLLALINDILDLAKIGAGKSEVDIGPVSASSVCQASLRLISEDANRKRLTVSSSFDSAVSTVQADERRLKQVLTNLLSNAVKFTPEGGRIGLDVVGDPERKTVQFTVWDTGIGISAEDMDQLFRPFVQVDSRLSRQYSGTGLGLSLVHRLVELHQGGIAVESEVGRGSRFIVSLPWQEAPEVPAAAEPREAPEPEVLRPRRALSPVGEEAKVPAQKPRDVKGEPREQLLILLAEDNEDNINTISDYLSAKGHRVVAACNGADALELAKEVTPDLILMDIQMPGMDGLEATRRIRLDARLTGIPIIALTALAMPGDRERCLAAGADEYMSKPVHLRALHQAIQAQVNTPRARP